MGEIDAEHYLLKRLRL